ncbi:Spindle pole body-associated protein cut125 / FY16936)) [Taphrina deformans PYCC 5710]|uniref:Spindle pole body-associated protein cut125 / FY16936 n=1 Tax=Taphrina deformans (strain PYCC 5710 / ATCC 11124 / CBS 356.35 / IMI 108563 / JCM 9778 / NBRC 8474) TaxID=1097556 RepID=R4XH96_TAPDE|nr:Spindle pole body-associated protein cut125 / FY16936)) [Taphrina deformans PYCC 5710]|eukprot:CCG82771.1 Spindle pole body-associated protein cut125 / FY16936)) [Taphrina deformans PYCC 5710]
MNWLMSNKQSGGEAPETPAHRWVFNALKGVVLPETPFPKTTTTSLATKDKLQNSILKSSRFTKERRANNVTFHKSVRTPPKRGLRSGLPREFPGRFPSPYTPRTVGYEDGGAESDGKDCQESPLGIEKDRRETSRASGLNPLKKLSLRLNDHKEDAMKSPDNTKSSRKASRLTEPRVLRQQAQPLKWDIDQGFAEVLESIHKNNDYLQSLIDEMQESCCQIEESFVEDRSSSGSDVTVNLDEPRSRSGQYWKAKFSDFSALTEKVRTEQNNMQRALLELKNRVNGRNNHLQETWKDKHDVLLEELAKAKRANRESAPLREVRELRRQVRDSQTTRAERDDLKQQLSIADSQIQDLQRRLESGNSSRRDAVTEVKATPASHKTTHLEMRSTEMLSDTHKYQAPQSATARRLAKAQAHQLAQTFAPKNEGTKPPVDLKDSTVPSLATSTIKETELRLHTGQRSKTLERAPAATNTSISTTLRRRTLTSSFPLPMTAAAVKSAGPADSPRPAFANLDVNAQTASQPVEDEATRERLARREAARKRLDIKRLERAKAKQETLAIAVR